MKKKPQTTNYNSNLIAQYPSQLPASLSIEEALALSQNDSAFFIKDAVKQRPETTHVKHKQGKIMLHPNNYIQTQAYQQNFLNIGNLAEM